MKVDDDEEAGLDLDDLTPAQLRKLIKKMMARGLRKKEDDDKELEKAEEEREKLSKLREESNGKGPSPKVKEDDMPEGLRDDEEDEDEKDSKKE